EYGMALPGLGPTRAWVGPGGEHGLVGVDYAGALLLGRGADVLRGRDDDPLDDRRRRGTAAVSLPVGLDHQRGGAGGQRVRLTGTTGLLHRRWVAVEIRAGGELRRGRAQRPVLVAGRHHVDGSGRLVEACRADPADVVVDPAGDGARAEDPEGIGLGVGAERSSRASRDDLRVGGRRADRVGHARVARGRHHGDARRHGGFVGLIGQVKARLVGERVGAERLVKHVNVIDADRPVDRLEEHRVEGEVGRAEHIEAHQAGTRCDAENPDQAWSAKPVTVVLNVVDVPALCGDGTRVEERLTAAGVSAGPGAAEVTVVHEDVLTVGTDEVGVVDVDAIGDPRHLDAGPGVAKALRGVYVRLARRVEIG